MSHSSTEKPHITDVSTYFTVFAALMVLLAVTYGAAKVDLDRMVGGLNLIVAMTIALVKALLVVLIFMHVKDSSRLTWVFAGAAFIWLIIMFVMFFSDYSTRGWQPGIQAGAPDTTVHAAVMEHNNTADNINVSPPKN